MEWYSYGHGVVTYVYRSVSSLHAPVAGGRSASVTHIRLSSTESPQNNRMPDFVINALTGIVLTAAVAAVIGTYIVTRRTLFISGGITHACFGGLGLGYFLGVSPAAAAAIFAAGSSLGADWLSRRRVRRDSAIAVVWAFGMALGILFVFLTPGYVPS